METIEDKILDSASFAYGVDRDQLTLETRLRNLSQVSIKLVAFISNIEEKTDVYINPRIAMNLETIQEYVDKVKEELA